MKICPNCGTKNSDSAKHCNFCDTHFTEPESQAVKETNYVHDVKAEKKKSKNRKILVILAVILVIAALGGILAVTFSGSKVSKSTELASIIASAFTEENTFSGTLKGNGKEISFSATVTKDSIIVLIVGGEYDGIIISKDGMVLETDRESGRFEVAVTKDMEEYKLYTAYLLLTSASPSPLSLQTNEIKNNVLPIVKDHVISNFDETFIEDNFISSISSVLMIPENDNYLNSLFGTSLPEDVKNCTIDFNVSSYDLQNQVLSQFKKAYKNSADYDEINQALKEAKSTVKKSYKANGSFIVENGKLKSAQSELIYKGASYTLNVSFS